MASRASFVGGEGSPIFRNPETLQKPYEIASLSSFRRECTAGEPSTEEEQRDSELAAGRDGVQHHDR